MPLTLTIAGLIALFAAAVNLTSAAPLLYPYAASFFITAASGCFLLAALTSKERIENDQRTHESHGA